MPDLAIDIRDITKSFDGHVAVRDLSLRVPAGSVYGLLGPNGAGKTTTIRMLLDIMIPDSGTVSVFGRSNREPGVLNRVGYLPEERGLYKKMQVRRVLTFLAELKGVDAGTADRRISEWLDRFGLRGPDRDWGTARVDELSRGMQQKVQFIATLLHDPDLIVLDEPFSGLDPINAQALKDTVIDLKRRNKTVLFSTHVMENAERMCDAVCIVANGRKVLDGTMTAVRASSGRRNVALALSSEATDGVGEVLHDSTLVQKLDDNNRYFELELAPGADPQLLLRRLVANGAGIERFELVQPSLHQIFLDHVGASGVETGVTGHG